LADLRLAVRAIGQPYRDSCGVVKFRIFALVKLYGPSLEGDRRYSSAECTGAIKTLIQGHPELKYVSTSYAERNNLNVRMNSRRMTRLTNAFSKKMENHAHAMALHFMYYNFVRIHQTLRTTPAMAAGVTKRLWEITDVVDVLEAWEKVLIA
jgi:hypothetical protein